MEGTYYAILVLLALILLAPRSAANPNSANFHPIHMGKAFCQHVVTSPFASSPPHVHPTAWSAGRQPGTQA